MILDTEGRKVPVWFKVLGKIMQQFGVVTVFDWDKPEYKWTLTFFKPLFEITKEMEETTAEIQKRVDAEKKQD